MRTIANMLRAVQNQDPHNEALQAMGDTRGQYLEKQKAQLYEGWTSKDQRLKPYALHWYATKKNKMNSNPGFGNPDFYLTGAFYRSFRADLDNDGLVVYAMDEKTNWLESRDPDIWTLGKNAKGEYIIVLKPVFIDRIIITLNHGATM